MERPEYTIVVQPLSQEDGGGYVAFAPDLPGCVSDGQTGVEALERAHEAIQDWIKRAIALGRPIPEPRRQRMPA